MPGVESREVGAKVMYPLTIYIFTVINKFEPNNFTDMHLNIAPDT